MGAKARSNLYCPSKATVVCSQEHRESHLDREPGPGRRREQHVPNVERLDGGEHGTVFRGPFPAVHLRNDRRALEFLRKS